MQNIGLKVLAKITIVMRLQVHVFFLHVRELIYHQWHKPRFTGQV